MEFLRALNRYFLIQIKTISIKGILLVGFIIPLITTMTSMNRSSAFSNTVDGRNYKLAEQSGFFDWYNSTWSYLFEVVRSVMGLSEGLSLLIFSSLLFGFIVWLSFTHLVYLFFELSIYLQWKFNKKKFVSKDEVAKYVYFQIFKENM
jgi:hypothetical protein